MGSNSNRSETRYETMNRFIENARSGKISGSSWKLSKGSEIRGKIGVEKSNAFIADMKKYK